MKNTLSSCFSSVHYFLCCVFVFLVFPFSVSASPDSVLVELTSTKAVYTDSYDEEDGDVWWWQISGENESIVLYLLLYNDSKQNPYGTYSSTDFDLDRPEMGAPDNRIVKNNKTLYICSIDSVRFSGGSIVKDGYKNIIIDAVISAYEENGNVKDTSVYVFHSNISPETQRDTIRMSIENSMKRCRLKERGNSCQIEQILASDDNCSFACISYELTNEKSVLTHYSTRDFSPGNTSFHLYVLDSDGNRIMRNVQYETMELSLYRNNDTILGDVTITTSDKVYIVHMWYLPPVPKREVNIDLTNLNALIKYSTSTNYNDVLWALKDSHYDMKINLRTDQVSNNKFYYEHFLYYTSVNYLELKDSSKKIDLSNCLYATAEISEDANKTFFSVSLLSSDTIQYNIRLCGDGSGTGVYDDDDTGLLLIENGGGQNKTKKLRLGDKIWIQKDEKIYDIDGKKIK